MKIELEGIVGTNTNPKAWDVKQIKIALNRLQYYQPDQKEGFDEAVNEDFIEALKQFQRENAIAADGLVGAGSVTERILNARIERQNPGEWYVWRTAGDEKVRDSHRMLEGRRFQWGNPPAETDGKHPGEDYNCRCTAEPLFKNIGKIHDERGHNKICIDLWERKKELERQLSEIIPDKVAKVKAKIQRLEEELQEWKRQLWLSSLQLPSLPGRRRKHPNQMLKDGTDLFGAQKQADKISRIREKIKEIEAKIEQLKADIQVLKVQHKETYEELLRVLEQIAILCPNFY